jgi:hypothetical protein
MSVSNPMRRLAVVTAALVLLGGAGCARAGSDQTPQATPSASPAPRVLTEVELKSALLTASDLPPGYTEQRPDETPEPESSSQADDPECAKLFDQFEKGSQAETNKAAEAAVEFAKSQAGPFVSQHLESYRDQAVLVEMLRSIREVVSKCAEFTETDRDGKLTIRMSNASFPVLGDETVAIMVTASGTTEGIDLTIRGYLVITRVANALNVIVHFGLRKVDVAQTEQIARKAVDKLTPLAAKPA